MDKIPHTSYLCWAQSSVMLYNIWQMQLQLAAFSSSFGQLDYE